MDKSLELLVNVGGTPIPVQGEDQDECVCVVMTGEDSMSSDF